MDIKEKLNGLTPEIATGVIAIAALGFLWLIKRGFRGVSVKGL